jgi:N-hydroxyarylamine O-acetyltransferase
MLNRDALLSAYFQRIGLVFDNQQPSLETLQSVQRAQVFAVPFENLDHHSSEQQPTCDELVSFGLNADSNMSVFPQVVFDKIVTRRRGGVCYEQNIVLGAMLGLLGFTVAFLKARVNRSPRGAPVAFNVATATHIVILVTIGNERFYVDAGMGPSALILLPCVDGVYEERVGEHVRRFWRVSSIDVAELGLVGEPAISYREPNADGWYVRTVIEPTPWRQGEWAIAHAYILSDPASWFRKTLIAIRQSDAHTFVLQNFDLVETEVRSGKSVKRVIDFETLPQVLREEFLLEPPRGMHMPLPLPE